MSYSFYKVIHLTGIFLIFLSYGGLFINRKAPPHKKWLMAFNGSGLLLALVGGFGLLARLNIMTSWPTWVWLKLAIWVVIAIIPSIAIRKNASPFVMSVISIAIGVLAIYLANFKPF